MLLFLSSKEQVLCLARAGKGGRGVLQRGAPAEPALLGAVGSGCWDGAGAPHPFPKRLAAGSSDARHPLRSFVSSWLVLDGMQLAGWFCCGVREGRGWERGASPPGSPAPPRGARSRWSCITSFAFVLLRVRPCQPGKNHSRGRFRHGDGWVRDEEGPGRLLIRRLPQEPSAVPSRGWDARFFQPNPLQQRSSAASPA